MIKQILTKNAVPQMLTIFPFCTPCACSWVKIAVTECVTNTSPAELM